MPETFSFCPDRYVPETLPPEPLQGLSMNGWTFTSRPEVPYQRKFKLTLHGLHWYLDGSGHYDTGTNPNFNAKLLEEFYQRHQTWLPFLWTHQHIGGTPLTVRFAQQLVIPAAAENSGGLINPIEVTFIHHDPGYV